jgi:hypothetical protein
LQSIGGGKTRKKSLLIIVTVMALSAVMVISAASLFSFNVNMNANVLEAGAVTVTVDSTTYNTGESFAVNWGDVQPGQTYTKSVTIHNNVNAVVTPSITSTLSSAYGTITLSSLTPIAANTDATVNIVFTVSSTAPAGTISAWTAALSATS